MFMKVLMVSTYYCILTIFWIEMDIDYNPGQKIG